MCLTVTGFHLFLPLFFFNDPATTEIYTLSLHDALPISHPAIDTDELRAACPDWPGRVEDHAYLRHDPSFPDLVEDRKSTRLNSSHSQISYAVFCLKKKKKHTHIAPHSVDGSGDPCPPPY